MGYIDNSWTLLPGYPQFSGTDKNEKVTMKYKVPTEQLEKMPFYQSSFPFIEDPYFSRRCVAFALTNIAAQPEASGDDYEVALTYEKSDAVPMTGSGGPTPEYEYSTEQCDKPLSEHVSYLVMWDHCLIRRDGVTNMAASNAAGKVTAEKKSEFDEKYGADWRFVKAGEIIPAGWVIEKGAIYPDVKTYVTWRPVVTMTKRSSSLRNLTTNMSADFSNQAPGKTFGQGSKGWLRYGSTLRRNGNYWQLQVRYLLKEFKSTSSKNFSDFTN